MRKFLTCKTMNNKAFTIMEILVVIIIVSVIAIFGLPNYNRSLERAYEREAIEKLKLIHAAQQLYFVGNDNTYWPPNGWIGGTTATKININLHLELMESGMIYACTVTGNNATFSCAADRGPTAVFTVSVDQTILSDTAGIENPCCGAGACPTLPNC